LRCCTGLHSGGGFRLFDGLRML